MIKQKKSGSALVLAVGISVAVIITFYSIVQFFNFMKKQSVLFLEKNAVLTVAEAGSNQTLGAIGLCPDLPELDKRYPGFPEPPTGDGLEDPVDHYYDILEADVKDPDTGKVLGHFKSRAKLLTTFGGVLDRNPIFYVVTTANVNPGLNLPYYNPKGETIRTYAFISDSAKYQIASANQLKIGVGTNLAGVWVFGRDLHIEYPENFDPATDQPTLIGGAFFSNTCIPDPIDWMNPDIVPDGAIVIGGDKSNIPTPVQDVVFPVIEDYDLEYFKELAQKAEDAGGQALYGSAGDVTSFNGDLYPPGYAIARPELHVKYTDGKFKIGHVTIHGQILFVAREGIIIDGDIMLENMDTAWTCYINDDHPFESCSVSPGCSHGCPDSRFVNDFGFNQATVEGAQASRAHMPVLITPENVVIKGFDKPSMDLDGDPNRLQINAFVYCPKGNITPDATDPGISNNIDKHKFLFKGSMVVLNSPDLFTYFQNEPQARVYEKNNSLSNPQTAPPGIPQFAVIRARFNTQE